MSQRYGDGVAPDVAEVDIVGSDESVGVNGVPIELCSCGVSVGRPRPHTQKVYKLLVYQGALMENQTVRHTFTR